MKLPLPTIGWLEPLIKLMTGQNPGQQLGIILKALIIPLLGILAFLFVWQNVAPQIDTSLGKFPGPSQVYAQSITLYQEHQQEREKEDAFYQRMDKRIQKAIDKGKPAERIEKLRNRKYTGKETFFDQIITSLITVMAGFVVAAIIAIPVGILVGLSQTFYAGMNPLIQIFKPVSPLAWLPLVTMVVSATYVTQDPAFDKSFLNSMFTVTLCSLWPIIINTAVGVSSIDKDLVNVSKVLRLGWFTHIRRIVLPSSIPMMFTGLRVALGIAWMVLIAAEMLAQNPGLGKFVWDEFQNGSSNSLGRIMVAVLVIGIIGFLLDRVMLTLQRGVSWDKSAVLR